MKLIDAALRCQLPRGRYAYIAPELKQAKGVAWDYIKHYVLKIPGATVNESETWVGLPNGARIRIYGADAPDSLRGLYFDGFVLDEVAQVKKSVWGEVLVPTLADRRGWALLIGTAKGINLLSDTYFKALKAPDAWYAECWDIDKTNALNPDELAVMKAEMTDAQWRQEMLCDFSASSDDSLISFDLVQQAMGRHLEEHQYSFAAKIVGVDVALGGGDKTVIQRRQGLAAFVPQTIDYKDTQDIADVVALTLDAFQADGCFIDDSGGFGAGVRSRLEHLGFDVVGVQFGGKARDARFVNRSVEMWWLMREWLEKGGALPRDNEYLLQLTNRKYHFDNAAGRMQLESKEELRKRNIKSPDLADALALTFASPVQPRVAQPARVVFGNLSGPSRPVESFFQHAQHRHEYDPYQRFADEQRRANG
jgi:hypothetical protein